MYSRGSVYYKIRDFRGRLFEAGRLFEEIWKSNLLFPDRQHQTGEATVRCLRSRGRCSY